MGKAKTRFIWFGILKAQIETRTPYMLYKGRLMRTASLVLTIAARGHQIRRRRCSSARGRRCPRAPPKVPPRHHGWTPVRPAFPPRVERAVVAAQQSTKLEAVVV